MNLTSRTILVFLITVFLLGCVLGISEQTMKKGDNSMDNTGIRNAVESNADVEKTIARLDTEYQQAVKINDADTMDRILADDFVLVTGSGKIYTKADLLKEARGGKTIYERQEDTEQTVRVWGDTAVITALLWEKGVSDGKPFDKKLWFSDTYVRTEKGWRYVFGQSSLPLPDSP